MASATAELHDRDHDAAWATILAVRAVGVAPWALQDHPLCRMLLPVARPRSIVVAQLGQSLDGRIATVTGASHFINGPGGIDHLHRLRALVDAVVVGAGIPHRVQRRLHVGGEHRAFRRQAVRQGAKRLRRRDEGGLVRVEAEHEAAEQVRRPFLDHAYGRIAVFYRAGKAAVLPGGAHSPPLAFRNAAFQYEALGSSADAAKKRADHSLALARTRRRAVANGEAATAVIPKGAGRDRFAPGRCRGQARA
ncbi:dihydrofolate reductase family protein [Hansschlegelia quercus]|uniref:dihydrofolate reductase family protein n=1 Tax=Hansschlegelia quercus TaxID=2528245 RepID=UPI00360FFF37